MASTDMHMDYSKYDFKDSTEDYVYLSKKGLAKETVEEISQAKGRAGLDEGNLGYVHMISL